MRSEQTPDDGVLRVFVAHPKSTYGTGWEADCMASISAQLPKAVLFNPGEIFDSSKQWRSGYRRLLASCQLVVVFADQHGWIGLGTFTEIGVASAAGLEIRYLDPKSQELCDRAVIREPPWRTMPRTPPAVVKMLREFARLRPIGSDAMGRDAHG